MRSDADAVGGFFEDLPVLAFVLAGVMSVSGTAAWVGESVEDAARERNLEDAVSGLVSAVVLSLRDSAETPTVERVRSSNMSELVDRLGGGLGCVVTVWCVHPYKEQLLAVEHGSDAPTAARSDRAFMNVLCAGGLVGILEVRALVWYT